MFESNIFNKDLIIILNREPWSCNKAKDGIKWELSVGGVTSAIDPLLQTHGGCCIAGGSSKIDFVDGSRVEVPPDNPKYLLRRVELSESDVIGYYNGFSNRCLWPLFHLFPEKVVYDSNYWKRYIRVNKKFADVALQEGAGDKPVWVHDYHLALIPGLLRDAIPDGCFAHFWHIPWVGWESFNSLPWREKFMGGLLGANLLGFQTSKDVNRFLECADNMGYNVNIKSSEVESDYGITRVRSFPIGVDFNSLQKRASQLGDSDTFKRRIGVKKIILSIDRLDYTKGLQQKLEAFQYFLENNSQFHGEVSLLLFTTPSRSQVREYKDMRRKIEETVGHINGTYGQIDWEPVKYFYRRISDKMLLSLFKSADVAMVTPLIDGMNLVSKEFVSVNDNGVLLLSEFAGAAEQMDKAMLVNPHDIEGTAYSLKIALELPDGERRRRLNQLREIVKNSDVHWWYNSFLKEWKMAYEACIK